MEYDELVDKNFTMEGKVICPLTWNIVARNLSLLRQRNLVDNIFPLYFGLDQTGSSIDRLLL